MSRRVVGASLLATSAAATAIVLASSPARADAPQQQGWWTVSNPGGLPATPPVSVPPDVPADGLLVQGGASNPSAPCGCTAFAGVVYALDAGATATQLTLQVAPNSATAPAATLALCRLVNPTLEAEQGGPMGDAPDYDCTHKVTAGPDSSGKTYTFNVSPLLADGSLAVAILPGDPTTRVVLSKPDATSLPTQLAPSAGSAFDTSVTGAAAASSSAAAATGGSAPAPAVPSLPSSATTAEQSPVVAASPSSAVGAPTSVNAAPVAAGSSTDKARPQTVVLVIAALLAGAGLWALAGAHRPHEDLAETGTA